MEVQPYLSQLDKPLFPKVLWNRPLSRSTAGRLLLIGGHRNDFSTIQSVYQYALASGLGLCSVALPDSLRPILHHIDNTFFVPSSPSGSIGQSALSELTTLALEHDSLAIGASLSNNSETTVAIERCLSESQRPACLYLDALEIVAISPAILNSSTTCLILSMPELFKLAGKLAIALNVRPERELLGRVEIVQTLAEQLQASLVCFGKEIIIASGEQTSVTPAINPKLTTALYAVMSAFWTHKQNFEHLTTAAYTMQCVSKALSNIENPNPAQIVKAIEQAIEID